jgi:DNA-binding CsgD family transcriptional regulator
MWGFHHKPESVHRVAWELVHGPVPKNRVVHHRCGTKLCCNLMHLETKRRIAPRRLSETEAQEICRWVAYGLPRCRIAKSYGISSKAVSKIVNNLTARASTNEPESSGRFEDVAL